MVTHALLREVQLIDGPTIALITLDNGHDHNKPNTFGPGGLASLDAALDAAESTDAAAIAVVGKPFIFVGADLTGVNSITSRAQALEVARLGHRVFRRLGEGPKPTFAFVNGAALGGGLELALHANYRTISTGVTALGFPECFLGLVPGWGGTYLLPRLIGPERALQVIVENALNNNRMLSGVAAFDLGIADALLEPADFLERSLAFAADVLAGRVEPTRQPLPDRAEWSEAVAKTRAQLDSRLHGGAPAPYRALELVSAAREANREEAFAAEDEALADLLLSDELRAGLYAFDLVRKRARRPAGAPDASLARSITKVGVVGAGLMASQLALLLARRLAVPVVMTDIDAARVDAGVAYAHSELDKLLARGRITPDQANRYRALISGSLSKQAFADADLVIEAVFEELSVKQQVFAECEAVVGQTCLLATNTSSLSVSAMADGLAYPQRVVGLHFFNPVAVLPLVEVVRAKATDAATLATAFAVTKALRKSAVAVADAPAFVVNRLLTRFLGEVTRAVDEGAPFDVADAALAPLGLPMPPSALLALVGPRIALHVSETLHEAFPDRFHVAESLRRAAELGSIPDVPASGGGPSSEEIRERALTALTQEIKIMIDDEVVADVRDIDLAMILGAGWPFHLGGITPYLDRTGMAAKVTGSRFHRPGVASV
ncbi:MAG: 3-hydroxyacyl-CoA dehydrogenase NAD-binding domain-containing protein [Mycobacteriales bacterium]